MVPELTALELFCGIGGFADAVSGGNVRVVGALDQSPVVLDVYRSNFPGHAARQFDLERIDADQLGTSPQPIMDSRQLPSAPSRITGMSWVGAPL